MKHRKFHCYSLVLILLISTIKCNNSFKIDGQTYFLSYIDKIPSEETLMTNSLSTHQLNVISKYNLGVNIPVNFQSVTSIEDPDAFIFYNPIDSSLLLAKCFDNNDTTIKQIEASIKYNFLEDIEYNDLSKFKHFKSCEHLITNSDIGPFLFGGTLYNLLGAETIMHQAFQPKSKNYAFGEFQILLENKKYLFIISLHNGYSEEFNNELDTSSGIGRWQAFRFVN
jgi:hypothetical protein